jgi:hypothetical protein
MGKLKVAPHLLEYYDHLAWTIAEQLFIDNIAQLSKAERTELSQHIYHASISARVRADRERAQINKERAQS